MKEDCRLARGLLERYLDAELDPGEAEKVAAHLAACPDCRAEIEQLRALDRLVRENEPPPLAEEYWDWHRREVWRRIRSRDRLGHAPTAPARFRWLRLATFATGIAAMLLLIVGGWRLLIQAPRLERRVLAGEEIAGVAPERTEPGFDDLEPEPRTPVAGETRPAPVAESPPAGPARAETPAPAAEIEALAATPKLARPDDPEPDRSAGRAAATDRELASALPEAAPETLSPEAALARHRAFTDSIRQKAARLRDATADSADEPPRLARLGPLPPAPGPDSLDITIRALVGPDGTLARLELTRGTGNPETDSLIRQTFTRAGYAPAYRRGLPVSGWLEITRRLAPIPTADTNR